LEEDGERKWAIVGEGDDGFVLDVNIFAPRLVREMVGVVFTFLLSPSARKLYATVP